MATKNVNITNADNKVTVTNSNNKIEVISTSLPSNIEITRPVTAIVEVKSPGPQGAVGITGPSGSQGIQGTAGVDGGGVFTLIDGGVIYATTSSLQISGSLYVSGSLYGDGSNLTGVGGAAGTISGSAQVIAHLPAGTISGSTQLPSGLISGSAQLPSGIISGSTQLPSGLISGSAQVIAQLPAGTISGSTQLPSGLISGSIQFNTLTLPFTGSFTGSFVGDGSLLTSLPAQTANDFTTTLKNKLDGIEALADVTDAANVLANLPNGIISGSAQLAVSVSGSFTSVSSSIASDIAINTAKVTNVSTNLSKTTAAAQITINSSDGDNVIIGEATDTIAGLMSTTHHDKLDGIEALADVTDAANVLANLPAGIISGSTQLPSGIISGSAQVIAQLPAGIISGSTQFDTLTLPFTGSFTGSFVGDGSLLTSLPAQTANDFTTTLKNKLDGIEALADVTDATNVAAAGALMDSELATIALVKALTPTMISGSFTSLSSSIASDVATNTAKVTNVSTNLSKTVSGTGFSINSSDGDNVALSLADTDNWGLMSDEMFDKLDGIEALADVTDATNVLASLVGTELVVKSITAELYVVSSSVTHMTTSFSSGSTIFGDDILDTHQFTGSLYVSGSLYGDGSNLTGVGGAAGTVSSSAQLPAGIISGSAQLPSGLISGSTQFDTLTLPFTGSFTGSFAGDGSGLTSLPAQTANDFTTTLKNKLDAIEASADVTDATNVAAAGALMDSELATIALVKALTPTMISGSFTSLSSSIASDVATNTAKVTNVSTNLTKTVSGTGFAINSSDGDNVALSLADTDNWGLMSDEMFDKLDGIEALADVTDAANVLANLPVGIISGSAQLPSGLISSSTQFDTLTLPFTGSFTGSFAGDGSGITGISGASDENFTTTLKNKLDAIEASADVTDATNVAAAGALMDSELATIALVKALTPTMISGSFTSLSSSIASDVATNTAKVTNVSTNLTKTVSGTGFAINSSDGDNVALSLADTDNWGLMSDEMFDKLDGIEALADVTDAANVLANLPAGIISGSAQIDHDSTTNFVANEHIDWTTDQGATNIHSGNYTDTNGTYSVGDGGLSEINFTTADNSKLDGIEALADVTDATNVAAAGALMDSELATIALVKALTPTMISGSFTSLSSSIASDVATNTAKVTNVSTNLTKTVSGTGFAINSSDGDNVALSLADTDNWGLMSDEMFDKLDGIEALADVTDAANVLANLPAGIISGSAQIDHDSTTNFVANEHIDWTADQGATNIHSGNYTDTNTTYSVTDGELSENNFTTTLKNKLDAIEASADVTDAANVLANLPANIISSSAQFDTITLPFTGSFTGSFQGTAELIQGDVKISGGSLGVGVTANATDGRIDASNDIVAYSSSDKRWKTNIKIIESPLEKLQKLSGVEFDWIEDSKLHGNSGNDVGVIAQEVELVLPQAVQTRDTGMKAVRYEKLIPLLIETIKEQQKQIDELKNKIG
jgi:hypothetical protein